jgi:hypothetical protein
MRLKPFIAGVGLGAAFAAAGLASSLEPYAWKDRVVVVFAAAPNAPLAEQRRQVDAARDALAERDMAVIAVIGDTDVEHWHGTDRGGDSAGLRTRFGVPSEQDFAVFLVGKDGGTKWQSTRPTDLREVIGLVDGMPMRRQEMSRGG